MACIQIDDLPGAKIVIRVSHAWTDSPPNTRIVSHMGDYCPPNPRQDCIQDWLSFMLCKMVVNGNIFGIVFHRGDYKLGAQEESLVVAIISGDIKGPLCVRYVLNASCTELISSVS